MNTITPPGNPLSVATRLYETQQVSLHCITHQSAAMYAALQVRYQYSRESKFKFSRECLDHLKASLTHSQDASA